MKKILFKLKKYIQMALSKLGASGAATGPGTSGKLKWTAVEKEERSKRDHIAMHLLGHIIVGTNLPLRNQVDMALEYADELYRQSRERNLPQSPVEKGGPQ